MSIERERADRFVALRDDAASNGMAELAEAYGWSAIRLFEIVLTENRVALDAGLYPPHVVRRP